MGAFKLATSKESKLTTHELGKLTTGSYLIKNTPELLDEDDFQMVGLEVGRMVSPEGR